MVVEETGKGRRQYVTLACQSHDAVAMLQGGGETLAQCGVEHGAAIHSLSKDHARYV